MKQFRIFLRQSISMYSFAIIGSIWKQVCDLLIFLSHLHSQPPISIDISWEACLPSKRQLGNANLLTEERTLRAKQSLGKNGERHPISFRQHIHGKALSIWEAEINSNMIVMEMSINTLILFEKMKSDFFFWQKQSLIWLTGLTMMTNFAI